MAEIIAEPTALSKVIPLKFKINDVDVPKTTQLSTNKQFNTTDTDAWFTFELDGLAATNGTYDLTLINLDDKSIFYHDHVLFPTLPFHYKLNSSEDVTLNEIRHAGRWLGQLVVTLSNGDTTARQFGFNIAGHILDGQDAQVILLSDYQALINTINLAKDDLAQYNVDYAALLVDIAAAEDARVTAYNQLLADQQANIEAFDVALDEGIVAAKLAEKLEDFEEINNSRLLSTERQLADKATKAELASVASGSPKGVYATLSALQSAYPSGNTNIYVVSADGNWYYWNGGAWTSGGVYQSEKLADNSVLLKNLSDDIVKKIHNIKDYNVASNALTDFTAVGTTALSLNGAYIKALSSGAPVEFKQYKDWGLPIGDKILVTFKVRANKSGNIIIYLLTNNVGGVLSSTTQSISATERTVSVVMSGPTLCNGIYFVGNDFTTSGDYVEILDLVVSDLSPVFGSGNEPTATKTRCYIWCSDNKYTDIREFLLTDTIQGAVVYVVKGTNTYTLTHNVLLSDINLVVRTDVITISGIVVTEVRTAFTGDVVTIKTNTTTLSTEVS